jgi:hypothetical protein
MNFTWDDSALRGCMVAFNDLPPEKRLFMSQYEFAEASKIDANKWREFLSDPRVVDWIQQELSVFVQAQQRKLIKEAANSNSRSVGAAQMLTALNKTKEVTDNKEGAMFIYTYVPPNVREQNAPNLVAETHDIFYKEQE